MASNRDVMEKTAELALVYGLTDLMETPHPGRIASMRKRLRKACEKEFVRVRPLFRDEMTQVATVVDRFATESGWHGKEKHIVTIVSFLLAVVGEKYPGITAVLNDIAAYFEAGNDSPPACYWAGDLAREKWDAALSALSQEAA